MFLCHHIRGRTHARTVIRVLGEEKLKKMIGGITRRIFLKIIVIAEYISLLKNKHISIDRVD